MSIEPVWLKKHEGTVSLSLYIQAGAKKNQIVGEHDSRLKVKIAAPPIEGRANEEILAFFRRIFSLSKSQVSLIRGATTKLKVLELAGVSPGEVLVRIHDEIAKGASVR